ncbi:hypothetical protein Pmani_035523 [Petrolisthes manimaculis]|uniref:Uncharacterized protein n=1 Tax=Petrolisthes manimaculis TaxID=1843537 RepID=A0AAE1TNM8_9EUCA|nr:hypothetical protein Pmani_035523 [Petrolisthes manimaculis]
MRIKISIGWVEDTNDLDPHPPTGPPPDKAPTTPSPTIQHPHGQQQQQQQQQQQPRSHLKQVWGQLVEVVSRTCLESTWHGPRHCWLQRGTLHGFLWLVLTFSLFIVLCYIMVSILLDFSNRDIRLRARYRARVNELPGGHDGVELDHATRAGGHGGRPEFLRETHHNLTRLLQRHNMTLLQLYDKISLSMGPQCCGYTRPITTVSGKCHALVLDSSMRQLSNSEYTGLYLYLKDTSHLIPELSRKVVNAAAMGLPGIQVSLLDNTRIPMFVMELGTNVVRPGFLTALEVTLTKVDNRNVRTTVDFLEPPCYSTQDSNFAQDSPSLLGLSPNCHINVMFSCISQYCPHCYPLYAYDLQKAPEEGRVCSVLEEAECMKATTYIYAGYPPNRNDTNTTYLPDSCLYPDWAGCARVCEVINFDHTPVVTPFSQHVQRSLTRYLGLEANLSSVGVVMVYFRHMEYTLHTYYRESLPDLLGTLGGYLGMLVGASLISALEVILGTLHVFLVTVAALLNPCH